MRLLLLLLLPALKLIALGHEAERFWRMSLHQVVLLLRLLIARGLGRAAQALGGRVVVNTPLVQLSLSVAGQHGHQGRVALWFRKKVYQDWYTAFARSMAVYPAVERF